MKKYLFASCLAFSFLFIFCINNAKAQWDDGSDLCGDMSPVLCDDTEGETVIVASSDEDKEKEQKTKQEIWDKSPFLQKIMKRPGDYVPGGEIPPNDGGTPTTPPTDGATPTTPTTPPVDGDTPTTPPATSGETSNQSNSTASNTKPYKNRKITALPALKAKQLIRILRNCLKNDGDCDDAVSIRELVRTKNGNRLYFVQVEIGPRIRYFTLKLKKNKKNGKTRISFPKFF